jgi:hypothetical protein
VGFDRISFAWLRCSNIGHLRVRSIAYQAGYCCSTLSAYDCRHIASGALLSSTHLLSARRPGPGLLLYAADFQFGRDAAGGYCRAFYFLNDCIDRQCGGV